MAVSRWQLLMVGVRLGSLVRLVTMVSGRGIEGSGSEELSETLRS